MTERKTTPLEHFFKVSALLVAMGLLGVMATTSGAAEGNTTRVSVDSSGNQATGTEDVSELSISDDGRYVAFDSHAHGLVSNDTNGRDVFVRDRQTGATELVSIDSLGNQANHWSFRPSISADGRFVAFSSWATNLAANDTNSFGILDVFLHDRQTGTTELVSVDSSGSPADGDSMLPSISDDGRYVAFDSRASNLVESDTEGRRAVFVRDRQTGTTRLASVNSSGQRANGLSRLPSISADGRFVAFMSKASNLARNDTNNTADVFVHDRQAGTTQRVSVNNSGNQANGWSDFPSTSSDGRYIAFQSNASNLVANDTNHHSDIFVRDRLTGTTQLVSVDSSGEQANERIFYPSISSDGRFVDFESSASNLVPNDTNDTYDVFVHDRQMGTTQRVSVDSSGKQGNQDSVVSSISSGGRFVAFSSWASNLVANDTNGAFDVFVHERDATAPRATSVVPTEGATGTAVKANLVATFSERMMAKSTLTKANFKLYKVIKNPDGTTTAKQITNVTVTPSSDGLKATLNPYGTSEGLLAKNTRYKAVVSAGAMDVFGNRLDQKPSVSGNQPKEWFFKTRG